MNDNLSRLLKITTKKKKRLGRGSGSGKGKTAGRGTKGQRSKEKVKFLYEGGQLALIKRLPMRRGKNRFKALNKKPLVVNVKYLNLLPEKTTVDLEALIKYRLVKADEASLFGVKILGDGEIKKPLTLKLPCSHRAKAKIEKAGGKVIL